MSTILIADHDPVMIAKLEQRLQDEGHKVIGVVDADRILEEAREHTPDLIVLDMDFGTSNSLIICNELRSLPHLTHVPILFMTSESNAVVRALDAGGDDIVSKPFEIKEVSARVRALLRRSRRVNRLHYLQIDRNNSQVWVNEIEVSLTPTEFQLLDYLCEHRMAYHTATELLEKVWRYPPNTGDTALVRNHVHNLRTKLENVPNRPQIIVSLHGRGYRVNANIEELSSQPQDVC